MKELHEILWIVEGNDLMGGQTEDSRQMVKTKPIPFCSRWVDQLQKLISPLSVDISVK